MSCRLHGVGTALGECLEDVDGLLVSHRRLLASGERRVLLDHVVVAPAGTFLLQEREWPGSCSVERGSLIRHRSGPGGQWARGSEDERVDAVRRLAEAVESVLSRPVEPVIVLTVATTTFSGPALVRGVTVMAADSVGAWLSSMPPAVDRAEMVLVHARAQRAFPDADAPRRMPRWVYDAGMAPPPAPSRRTPSLRTAPGPRDYTLAPAPASATDPCVPAGSGPRSGGFITLLSGVAGAALVAGALWSTGAPSRWWEAAVGGEVPTPVPSVASVDPGGGTQPPPTQEPLDLATCLDVPLGDVSAAVGTPLQRLEPSAPEVCWFARDAAEPASAVVRVDIGPAALADVGRPMGQEDPFAAEGILALTYGATSLAPDGSGRVLAQPLRVVVAWGGSEAERAWTQAVGESVAAAVARSAP